MDQNKTDLVVLYGANSALLAPLLSSERFKGADFIRIFNTSIPEPHERCMDLVGLHAVKSYMENLDLKAAYRSIIFIGAAFVSQNSLFVSETQDSIQQQLGTNVLSYVDYTHLFLKYMLQIRSGCFVYLSSFRGEAQTRGVSLYSASKAFGEAFFSVIGQENARLGVHTVSIRMGYFDGRMTDILGEEKVDSLKLNIGARRLGSGDDLCSAITFAVDNPYLNGGRIDLNGGLSFP